MCLFYHGVYELLRKCGRNSFDVITINSGYKDWYRESFIVGTGNHLSLAINDSLYHFIYNKSFILTDT